MASMAGASSLAAAEEKMGWQATWDNDVWARGRTDRWYTNGIRVTWTYSTPPESAISAGLLDASRWFLWEGKTPTLSYTIGQSMYTPRRIDVPTPQLGDRPWGAFLFGGITAHAYKGGEFRTTELKLGTMGKAALGEPVQKLVHRITDSPEPLGWDQQVNTRIGIQLSHARVYRFGEALGGQRVGFQAGFGGAVGTLRNYGTASAAMTVGNLSGSDPPLLIGNEGDFVVQDFNDRTVFRSPFAYVAVGGTAIAYNYFVEGRTRYGRSDIDMKSRYGVVQWGVSIPLQSWIGSSWPRIVYMQTRRTPEFTSAAVGRDESVQRWGTFAFHWDL